MTKGTLLHTTKITSSKIREDMDRKKYDQYPQGRYISLIEMLYQILKVPEVITDLIFISIPTVPLEYRSGIDMDKFMATLDEVQIGSVLNNIRLCKELPNWRQHTASEMLIYEDLTKSNVSIDKITLFSLQPPELRKIVSKTIKYFR